MAAGSGKGRAAGNLKLTDAQVLELARMRDELAMTYKDLADYFGVSIYTAWNAYHVRASRLAPELFGRAQAAQPEQAEQDGQQVVELKGWGGRVPGKPRRPRE